jgi:hypothetical protein
MGNKRYLKTIGSLISSQKSPCQVLQLRTIPVTNPGPIKKVIKILEANYNIFNPIKLESELEIIKRFLPHSL